MKQTRLISNSNMVEIRLCDLTSQQISIVIINTEKVLEFWALYEIGNSFLFIQYAWLVKKTTT